MTEDQRDNIMLWRCESCSIARCKSMRLDSTVDEAKCTLQDIMLAINEIRGDKKLIKVDLCEASDLTHKKISNNKKAIDKQSVKIEEKKRDNLRISAA